MVFHALVLQFYLKNGQKKKEDDNVQSEKKQRKNVIYVDENHKGNCLIKHI